MANILLGNPEFLEEIMERPVWEPKLRASCPKCAFCCEDPFDTFDIEYMEESEYSNVQANIPDFLIVTCNKCGYKEYFRCFDFFKTYVTKPLGGT